MYSGRQQTTTVHSRSCARSFASVSPTSTPATTMARILPINLSKRRCIHIRSSCGSSPSSGARRDAEGNWPKALAPDELRQAVHDNLANLGLNTLDVVNLRVGGLDAPEPGSIAEPFSVLAEMQQQGLIKHLGVSTVNAAQIAEAQSIAPVVCVQNFYNIAHRQDDSLIDSLAKQGIAYVPYFPLGGFSPLQSDTLSSVAARLDATPMAVALAWLLQRSPNILLIPGTSSVEHLRENVAGAGLELLPDAIKELDSIAG